MQIQSGEDLDEVNKVNKGGGAPLPRFEIRFFDIILTGHIVPARFVHLAGEELEADDGVNNDDEQNEESDVEEGYHRS